jgi:hypothetical protein
MILHYVVAYQHADLWTAQEEVLEKGLAKTDTVGSTGKKSLL